MVVLLAGGGSVLMNAIIDKLNKNGHRVYLLTGKKENRFSYRRVFEKYNFSYESGSIKDIIDSIKPDVMVFTGAYDTNFNWESPRQEAVGYTAGLMNILSAFSMTKTGRFFYLSSQEVYGASHIDDIPEEEQQSPKGFRAMAMVQGEEICANYRKTQGTETVILRFDHLYWVPEKGKREEDPCFRMCLEALRTGKISANSRHSFSMIYLNDAVEQLYKVISSESPKNACYHITSSEEINERKLAEMIQEEMDSGIEIVDNTVGMSSRLVLDGGRFKEEYGREIFSHYDTGVKQVVRFMKHHSNSFLTEEDSGGGLAVKAMNNFRRILKALFPYIENLIGFVIFYLLNSRAAESQFVAKLDFYLLYVLDRKSVV